MSDERFIRVPAAAREEIGQLTQFLEQGLRNLRDITEHLRGGGGARPSVLDDLRDVVRITEAAAERMLDETEALVDDGREASRLLADVRRRTDAAGETIAEPLRELGALIDRSNDRAMEIMSALEFQDLTSQKVQRTFGVLEEVLVRVGKIQRLVDAGAEPLAMLPPASDGPAPDAKAGQRLADELMLHFATKTDL